MSRDVEKDWEFWKDIIMKDGVIDIEQLKKELSDFSMILDEVPKVYDHITGGLLSKPTYPADVVITQADDHSNECFKDNIKDLIRCHLDEESMETPLEDLLGELDGFREDGRTDTAILKKFPEGSH